MIKQHMQLRDLMQGGMRDVRFLNPGWGAPLHWAPIAIPAGKAEEGTWDVQKTSLVQRSPQALAEAQFSLASGILEAQSFAVEAEWFSSTDGGDQ